MDGFTLERVLPDEAATSRLGEDIAAVLRPGDVVALQGDLGAGKTALARAVIRAIAGDQSLEVPSPTFTLVQFYDLRLPIHHFDLYRVSSAEELEELGLAEAVSGGVALVEWPERAGAVLGPAITVVLREEGAGRAVSISAPDEALERLARSSAIRTFLDEAGHGGAHRTFLLGDASVRAYETVSTRHGETLILMNAPSRHDEPVVRHGLPYSRIARLAQSVSAFVGVTRALREAGFAAPEIRAQDLDRGLLLIEHLGTGAFLADGGQPVPERYTAAAQLLAAIHEHQWSRALPVAPGLSHHLPSYDRGALAIETELLLEWYVPHVKGRPATDAEAEAFEAHWRALFDRLEQAEQSLVLRDFHSPNLIWRGECAGFGRLGLIDIQDAVIGPAAYDVASLALDARVTIGPDLEKAIVDAYCEAREAAGDFDRARFAEAYAITAAQRNSKLLGIFVRLDRRDGKPAYLRHLPRIRAYLERVMHHPALADLRDFYRSAGFLEEESA